MASEITEVEDENSFRLQDKEAEKLRIRQIIDYQKSLFLSSSSSSSSSSSFSSASHSSKSSRLLDLMREGSTSLGRLFDMEHTSLGNYFKDYSVSPIIKPILLWGSDSDNDHIHGDPWVDMRRIGGSRIVGQDVLSSHGSFRNDEPIQPRKRERTRSRKLMRTKSYTRLPRFSLWRCGGFKFKLRLIKKLRVVIRGRKL